ncbi:hypothetical protein LAUMK7_05736 [Mycobacterium kansasii]|nr:hypothetical protein LAUMK7_05736 [Mycobacterium kansasii]
MVFHPNSLDQFDFSDDGSDTSHIPPNGNTLSTQRKKLLRRADEGDLQSRLDIVSQQTVEMELGRCHRRGRPNQTILDFLQHPGDSLTPAQAAAQVLNELADETEETALTTVFVWRYIQLNEIWNTHANPKLRSMQAFLRSLEQDDIVMANIVVGTTTQNNKRRNILAIHNAWGAGWFDLIPRDLLPPRVTSPFHLSRRLLLQITAACKQGITLMDAIVDWRTSIQARLEGQVPRSSKRTRISKSTFLIPDDLERLNQTPAAPGRGAFRAAQISGIKQDRIELKGPPVLRTLAPKPSLKRKQDESVEDADGERVQMRLSKDGTKQLVRVRNHLIAQPVPPPTQSVAGPSQQPSQGDNIPPSAQRDFGKSIFIEDTDESEAEEDNVSQDSGTQSCEASIVLQRLADQASWSQDSRKCCAKCKRAVASVRYAIHRATAVIKSSHLGS